MKNKTITIDLETWTPSVLGNATGGIHPSEMMIFSSARQTGKSMYMKMLKNRIYNTNLCKEITLTGQELLQEFTINWGKPVSKYKFSRAKWHTVEIGGGGWRLGREYNEIIEWCTEQFGKHPDKPDAWSRWWVGVGEIYFRDEKDFVFYKLRWS